MQSHWWDSLRSIRTEALRLSALLLFASVVLVLGASGCSPREDVGPILDSAADQAALSALDIPQDATRTATPAATSQVDAVRLRTDAPASFYVVKPGVDNWFAIDDKARTIGWSTVPGTEVGLYFVAADGSRTEVDASGLERPLYTPDPAVDRGNGAGQRYLSADQKAIGPGWLVVVPRTYDNESGVFGVQLKSKW